MVKILFYPIFLLMIFILSLIYIPKRDYKEYFIYGVLIGGLGDVLVVGLFQNLLHIIWFKNAGIFNALGQNLLSPPCWLFVVMLFLRFLPRRRPFLYLYVITVAFSSVGYGMLVRNVGLFDYQPWFYPFFSFLTFLGWWSFATWIFLKTSTLSKSDTKLF
ncbi:MAG: membrane protein [Peptococcaceae bacterium BICA1-8]|nr:MAG: membrane protein [Peptococcaceae bacterium BICA1-8]